MYFEFTKSALGRDSRQIAYTVVETKRPVRTQVIGGWPRQRTLTAILDNPARSEPQSAGGRIETTQEEFADSKVIHSLDPISPDADETIVGYIKIQSAGRC